MGRFLGWFLSACVLASLSPSLVNGDNRVVLESFRDPGASQDGAKLRIPFGWQVQGRAAESRLLTLTVALKHQNIDALKQKFETVSDPDSEDYGNYMSIEEIADLIAPPTESARKVESFFLSHGAQVSLTGSRDFLRATLSVAAAESLFQTKLYTIVHPETGMKVIRGGPQYTIPADIAPHVDLVGGLVRLPKPAGSPSSSAGEMTIASGVELPKTTPAFIRKLHRINLEVEELRHPKNTQCVVSFLEQYISKSDTSKFFKEIDPLHRTINKVEKWIGPNDESKPGEEASLDIQYLMGVANNVRTWVWNTGGLHEKQEPFLEWLSDVAETKDAPFVFSISYQDYEPTVSRQYMDRINIEFQKLAIRGRTVVTGSGDWGAGCTDSCDRFFPDFPSSSPYITSLGATLIQGASSLRHGKGKVYSQAGAKFSSGGFSDHFERPAYQDGAVRKYLNTDRGLGSYFNASGRAFPDIAAIGVDFQVIVGSKVENVLGTSASTPTFAAMVSLINDGRLKMNKPTMGFVNPFLYRVAERVQGAFEDIVDGEQSPYKCCTKSFAAVEGWDPMTGLGTPRFDVLYSAALGHRPHQAGDASENEDHAIVV